MITDLKTAANPSPEAWAKQALDLGYHRQASWYRDGVEACGLARDAAFAFIVVRSSPPHEVAVYELDEEDLGLGAAENRATLREIAECTRTGNWSPEWAQRAHVVKLPKWRGRRAARKVAR